MKCPQCSFENEEGAPFCENCGEVFPEGVAPETEAETGDETKPLDAVVDSASRTGVLRGVPSVVQVPSIETPASDDILEVEATVVSSTVEPKSYDDTDETPAAVADFMGFTQTFDSDAPDFTGFETIVDSSYVPPEVLHAGDTAEIPTVTGDYAARSRTYASDLTEKELRRREREQEKLARKFAKKQGREQADKAAGGSSRPLGRRHSKIPVVLAACVLVVLACAGIAWGSYYAEVWGGRTVPFVVGDSLEAATALLEDRGFSVEATEEKSDEAQGSVLSMNPAGGTRAQEGSVVQVVVAAPRVIPEVVGLSRDEAMAALEAEGLLNIEVAEQKSDEADGSVLSVTPDVGSVVLSTDPVDITVAVPYTVPDVVGMDEAAATEALAAETYGIEVEWSYNEDVAEGSVISTEPSAGTQLQSGSTVVVYLAKSRATELVERTQAILPGARLRDGDTRYIVDEVNSVSYAGDNVVTYSCTAHRYEDVELPFGQGTQRVEEQGNPVSLEGSLTFNDADEVTSADPSISYS